MTGRSVFMKKQSRTTYTLYNFVSSMGGQAVTILTNFITRTVFIATLGKAYLGIGGLFSNILMMLSLAELGVGNAIIFKLYKPIAEDDRHRVTLLMKFYRQVYNVIGVVIALLGLCLIPFLPSLIRDYDKLAALHINAVLIFCLYLLQSVSSYFFFAYKSAIVMANQQEYLLTIVEFYFTIGLAAARIIMLLLYPSFEIFVILGIVQVIIRNLVWARMADRRFPYINDPTEDSISRAEIMDIFKDCGALFLYKLNGVVLKATDNIILSMFLGLEIVGMYSNYYIFYSALHSIFFKVFNSAAHSIGNLHAVEHSRHEYEVFRTVFLIAAVVGGTAGVGILVCADDFVLNWVGSEWVFAQPFSLLMGIEIFTLAYRHALSRYRAAMGLFQQAKYRPLFGMLINLIVSILLVRVWGICGVLAGTIAADWLTVMWYDPLIIHKYGLHAAELAGGYFVRLVKSMLIVTVVGGLDYWLCQHFMTDMGWFSVIAHAALCAVTVPFALLLGNINSYEGKYIVNALTAAARKAIRIK